MPWMSRGRQLPQIQNNPRPPGQRANGARGGARDRVTPKGGMADVGPEPPDKEVLKNSPLSNFKRRMAPRVHKIDLAKNDDVELVTKNDARN